ncbi:MAG: hypothetical protein HRT65_12660 [Flavobacteriaceae bacterium]|nr:hypothetical protein [Flavobacteriaceae bacterium]
MNKTLKSILKYFVEIIIVAFGVFLGVYYSNVNADNKTKIEKQKSLNLIIKELELNKKLLEDHISYHKNIRTEMDSIVPTLSEKELYSSFTEAEFKRIEIKGWTGFNFARLQKTAFETAKTSGLIKEFDIELVQKLSDVYYFQDVYVDFGTSILNKAIGINTSMKIADLIGTIRLMTSDLLGLEKELSTKLEKTLAELKTLQET